MTIHLMCLTADGGLPIFTRKRGNCENLPFTTVASLNGVHMFFKSMGICMNSTIAEDWVLLWKDYEEAVTIILCGKYTTANKLELLSDLVFHSFKLFVNSDDLRSSGKLVDRLKREAKQYMPIVDSLIDSNRSDILGFNDCIILSENAHLLGKLNEFSVQCDSLFCCIVINQKLAVGTEGWWDLDLIDRKLLIAMLNSSDRSQLDVPVYLPKKSSNAAYRFVSVPIVGNGILCVICGADPSYQEINNIAQNLFKNEAETMKNIDRCIWRNFPEFLEINEYILKTILLNRTTKKYAFSQNLQQSLVEKCSIGPNRLDNIQPYVDQVLETLSDKAVASDDEQMCTANCVDQHWCSEYHKCYAHCDDNGNVFLALFTASIPTYAMRLITQKLFTALMQEKNICW